MKIRIIRQLFFIKESNKMIVIRHKFAGRKILKDTKILIIGTFNPDTPQNTANFFYSRPHNYLWEIIPTAFGSQSLKKAKKDEKEKYIKDKKIDFIDIIEAIEVETDKADNYADDFIDNKIIKLRNVIAEFRKLKDIKKVGFSRKTFDCNIPQIKKEKEKIENFCKENRIYFQALSTPSRSNNVKKQKEWTDFLIK
jgi:G:T/U-mismatch repair DNA glycosylase